MKYFNPDFTSLQVPTLSGTETLGELTAERRRLEKEVRNGGRQSDYGWGSLVNAYQCVRNAEELLIGLANERRIRG